MYGPCGHGGLENVPVLFNLLALGHHRRSVGMLGRRDRLRDRRHQRNLVLLANHIELKLVLQLQLLLSRLRSCTQ